MPARISAEVQPVNLGAIATSGAACGKPFVTVTVEVSPPPSKVTDAGDALGPLDGPGQPTEERWSLAPGVHTQAYDTEFAPPVTVSFTLQVSPATGWTVGLVPFVGFPAASNSKSVLTVVCDAWPVTPVRTT